MTSKTLTRRCHRGNLFVFLRDGKNLSHSALFLFYQENIIPGISEAFRSAEIKFKNKFEWF